MKKYKLINDFDGNDSKLLDSTNQEDAVWEALNELGYSLVEYEGDEEE